MNSTNTTTKNRNERYHADILHHLEQMSIASRELERCLNTEEDVAVYVKKYSPEIRRRVCLINQAAECIETSSAAKG